MRTLTYLVAVTADGFIAAQDGSLDAFLNDLGYFIDELILKVNPVLLGSGIPLFACDAQPRGLELLGSDTLAGKVSLLRY